MSLFNFIKRVFTMKNKTYDYQKEHYRGTIKQIMKVRGLRTISLANYNEWKGKKVDFNNGVHSLKLDLQDGYVNIYGYGKTSKGRTVCGQMLEDNVASAAYREAYEQVMNLISEEQNIPYKVRKNILVKLAR